MPRTASRPRGGRRGTPDPVGPRQSAGVAPTGIPLLRTKLHPPAPRAESVSRSRLEARLDAGLRGKVTLIAAPAGFGKTTLIGAWRLTPRGRELPLAWISLDAGDNDPLRFWSYLSAALETAIPGLGAPALALLQAPQPPPIEGVLTGLLNRLASHPGDVVLALDDYHAIEAAPVHQSLAFLIDHLPAQLHLVIASRADPPLPLARLRARGELTELRTADLRFATDEATAFLGAEGGLDLTPDEVVALGSRTEGWIAGLQLAALALRGYGADERARVIAEFTGSARFVADYLIEEVLAQQSDDLQTFLLRTSVLDRLCAPLCAAILGVPESDSQAALDTLERGNLFLIPLDGERGWYRYHHLFAELLRHRLQRASPQLSPELHRRASVWYEGASLLDEAIRHALATGDSELVTALVERHIMAVLYQSHIRLGRTWLGHLAEDAILARPRLTVAKGWVLTLNGDPAAAERLLASAEQARGDAAIAPEVAGELAVLAASMARFGGDDRRSLELSQRALDMLADDQWDQRIIAYQGMGVSYHRQRETAAAIQALREAGRLAETSGRGQYAAIAALVDLSILQADLGQLGEALRSCSKAIDLAARWGQSAMPGVGMAYLILGELLCERNDLDGAKRALEAGIALLPGTGEYFVLARGYIALGRVCHARGDSVGALATIDRAESWLLQQRLSLPDVLARLAAYRARVWLAQGELAFADGWARESSATGPRELSFYRDLTLVRWHLVRARLRRDDGAIGEAAALLDWWLATAERQGFTGFRIESLLLQALARQVGGRQEEALQDLGQALTLAAPEGYVHLFLDEGPPLMALLARWLAGRGEASRDAQEREIVAYARHLQSIAATAVPGEITVAPAVTARQVARMPGLAEPLGERELTVLRLMAVGHANPEIARQLFVATSTVKWYVNSIFGKLAVTSRTAAVARARALGLLQD